MNKIFFVTFLTIFLFSCSTFVNLGDSETSSNNSDSLPEELNDSENYNDTGNSGDTGNTGDAIGDSGNTGDTGNTGNSGNSGETGDSINVSDEDYYAASDEDSIAVGEYPFDDEFSTEDCGCGDNPVYEPICCDGTFSVFNKCFANCYNIHSDGQICFETVAGVCEKVEQPDNEIADNEVNDIDSEINDNDTGDTGDVAVVNDMDVLDTDSDIVTVDDLDITDLSDADFDDSDTIEIIDNECGCYPNDTELYCCYVNGTVLVSKCMADCMCAGGYSNCY